MVRFDAVQRVDFLGAQLTVKHLDLVHTTAETVIVIRAPTAEVKVAITGVNVCIGTARRSTNL